MARLTLPATYQAQLQNIQQSPKFQDGKAVSFPGYSVISPPRKEDEENSAFYSHLEASQQQLWQQLVPDLLTPIPPDSFHVTVADLIWENAYQEAVKANPYFDRQLQAGIQDSFKQYQPSPVSEVGQWQLLGLLVFPRALAVGLVPKDEAAYEAMLQLRRAIYQNSDLITLGIEQQYYFTTHITLGYFSEIPSDLDRDHLATVLANFNDRWLESEPQILSLRQVQLRQFTDMTCFKRDSDWAMVNL